LLDPLSDVLSTLRLHSSIYFRTELGAPWGLDVPALGRVARFHVVVAGRCHVEVPGPGRVALLERGDLALVPHGARHLLRSQAGLETVPLDAALDSSAYDGSGDLRHGGEGERTTMVCGHFAFDDEALHPALAGLEALLHLRAADGYDFTWLDAAARSLGRETAARLPGWKAVVDRAAEILFVQALRSQYARAEAPASLAAFSDARLARCLAAIHAEPEREWTLEQLAATAGMSRTAFAVRFRNLAGLPPMAYVTRWRLQRARRELLDSTDIVAAVAARFGFDSEASFSRAFRRLYGLPPATYRRQHAA
jgi:AraC-like DNA-binding protein